MFRYSLGIVVVGPTCTMAVWDRADQEWRWVAQQPRDRELEMMAEATEIFGTSMRKFRYEKL